MRSVHEWFDSYGQGHQHPANRAIHWVCVPAILWCVIALLWVIPVPAGLGRPGLWSVVAMFAAYLYYNKLSRNIGYGMAATFIVLALMTAGLHHLLGSRGLLWLAIAVFVVAWIGQFMGHRIEGRRPAFLADLSYLLIGPAWLLGKMLRRWNVSW